MTATFKKKFDLYALLRPFRVNTEQLELLEPVERIQVESINALRSRNFSDQTKSQKHTKDINRFSLLTDIVNRMSSNSKLFTEQDYLLLVVKQWMEIFLWFFEAGYYDDQDLKEVLLRVKECYKLFNEVNITEFVQWYSKFAIVFIKAALFRMQCQIIKVFSRKPQTFKARIRRFLGDELKEEELNLSFGSRSLT